MAWDKVWDGMSAEVSGAKRSRGLTATFVRQVKDPGRYGDGHGLYLVVDPSGASRWVLRIQMEKRRRDIGLGSSRLVSLAEAREKSHEIRKKTKDGCDPVAVRRAERETVPTFEQVARTVHQHHLKVWRNGKHAWQWIATLEAHAFPFIGDKPVNKIETGDILRILLPIWTSKQETARRVLQRIRTIIDHAAAAGHRSGENPCRIAAIGLPRQTEVVKHHAALPYAEVPAFLRDLQDATCGDFVRLAFEFLVLTAARSNEIRGATIEEFDFESRLWTIPGERMKAEREHVVPLTDRAVEIVRQARKLQSATELIFPSRDPRKPLSDMAFIMVLRRMGLEATAHGFRSSFRDWCSEETPHPREVAEMALAHTISNKVEAAYRRGKLLIKRRELMDEWARFCSNGGQ